MAPKATHRISKVAKASSSVSKFHRPFPHGKTNSKKEAATHSHRVDTQEVTTTTQDHQIIEYEEVQPYQWKLHKMYDRFTVNPTSSYPLAHFSRRMAYRIHREAVKLTDATWSLTLPYFALPDLAKYYSKGSKDWNVAMRSAFQRIALRMVKGFLPTPNCVAEIVALRAIMKGGYFADELSYGDKYNRLPITKRDYQYDVVRLKCFDSDDNVILKCLFGAGEDDFNSNGAEEFFNPFIDNDPPMFTVPSPEWQWVGQWNMGSNSRSKSFLAAWHSWLEYKIKINEKAYSGITHAFDTCGMQINYSKQLIMKHARLLPKHKITNPPPKLLNMHPKRWFLPFHEEDMRNHLII